MFGDINLTGKLCRKCLPINCISICFTSAVFKRTDTSKSHGTASNSASGGKPAGMAALAATYKGSSGSSASSGLKSSRSGTHGSNFGHSKTSAGSSSGSSSSSTIMSADKRLQLMKKKAAQRKK